jgi:hypothetical protein
MNFNAKQKIDSDMKLKNLFSKLFGSSRARIEQEVATLIADGKIPEAIQVLLDAGHTDAALLKARWDALHAQQEKKPLDWEAFSMQQNRILYALIEMAKPPGARMEVEHMPENPPENSPEEEEVPEPPTLSEDQRGQLRVLLEQGQWQQALELGQDWSHELHLLRTQHQTLEKHYHLNLITQTNYEQQQQRIEQGVRYFVQRADE